MTETHFCCLYVESVGFKKAAKQEKDKYDDEYSYDEDDTEDESRSKAAFSSVSTNERERRYKMDSYHEGQYSVRADAPIPSRPPNLIQRELGAIGARIASRFMFGARKIEKPEMDEEKHAAFARGKISTHQEHTLDESESIADPTKVLDDDHVAAGDRIRDFERRMKAMSNMQKKMTEEEENFDQSTVSSRPMVPVDIKFAAILDSKNPKGSGEDEDSSSSSHSSSSSSSSSSSNSSDSSALDRRLRVKLSSKIEKKSASRSKAQTRTLS